VWRSSGGKLWPMFSSFSSHVCSEKSSDPSVLCHCLTSTFPTKLPAIHWRRRSPERLHPAAHCHTSYVKGYSPTSAVLTAQVCFSNGNLTKCLGHEGRAGRGYLVSLIWTSQQLSGASIKTPYFCLQATYSPREILSFETVLLCCSDWCQTQTSFFFFF
jgi:hypothetical protein